MDDAYREAELLELSQQFKGEPCVQQTVITCMTTIKKAYDEVQPLSSTHAQHLLDVVRGICAADCQSTCASEQRIAALQSI